MQTTSRPETKSADQLTGKHDFRVLTKFLWPMLTGLRLMGLPVQEIAKDAGLSPEVLANGEMVIPLDDALRLSSAAVKYTGRPALGLELAQFFERHEFGVVDWLARSCASLGDAIQKMCGREQAYQTVVCTELRVWGELAAITQHYLCTQSMPPYVSDNNLANMVVIGRKLVEGEVPLLQVSFRRPAPSDTRAHQAFFRCPVMWGAIHDQLLLPASALAIPIQRAATPSVRITPRTNLDLERSAASSSQKVRALLQQRADDGRYLVVQDVARHLKLSERTLQRCLHKEGTSFARLVGEVLLARAKLALTEQRKDEDVAWKLGFSDPRAFRRAFKRWTGQTPAAFRAASCACVRDTVGNA